MERERKVGEKEFELMDKKEEKTQNKLVSNINSWLWKAQVNNKTYFKGRSSIIKKEKIKMFGKLKKNP